MTQAEIILVSNLSEHVSQVETIRGLPQESSNPSQGEDLSLDLSCEDMIPELLALIFSSCHEAKACLLWERLKPSKDQQR